MQQSMRTMTKKQQFNFEQNKEAKNDGALFKNASWMILMKIEEPKRRGRIGRNATTTNNRIWNSRFRRGETAVMLIF